MIDPLKKGMPHHLRYQYKTLNERFLPLVYLTDCDKDVVNEYERQTYDDGSLVFVEDLRQQVFLIMAGALKPRDLFIMVARFGLDGNPSKTYEDLASHYGVGCERIRQIEARALRQLQQPRNARRIAKLAGGVY